MIELTNEQKTQLRKQKVVKRKLEMVLDSFGLSQGYVMQFCEDARFGLVNALGCIRNELTEAQYNELVETALKQK